MRDDVTSVTVSGWILIRNTKLNTQSIIQFVYSSGHFCERLPLFLYNCMKKPQVFSQKTRTFIKNPDFLQKCGLFSKNATFIKKRDFYQKSRLFTKTKTFFKKRDFYQKTRLLSKVQTFHKNQDFFQKYRLFQKI